MALDELRRGICHSTGGTHIGCVAEHMQANHVRRALVVTDGFVGRAAGAHAATLSQARIAIGYVGQNINERDLAGVADYGRHVPLGG